MPRYMSERAIDSGNGSGTNVVTSEVIDFRNSYGYSIQFNITGTSPVGTAVVQGSNDETNWTSITSLAISAVGSSFDNKDAIYWSFLRVRYTGTSGTGVVVNAYINTKGG